MMSKDDELLPLGSVVIIHNQEYLVVQVGVINEEENEQKYYDYALVNYPEGLTEDATLAAQASAIDKVEFVGYQSPEFLEKLEQIKEEKKKMETGAKNNED